MATQKRRVIYLSDEDWSRLQARAHDQHTTISAAIRQLLISGGANVVTSTRAAPVIIGEDKNWLAELPKTDQEYMRRKLKR